MERKRKRNEKWRGNKRKKGEGGKKESGSALRGLVSLNLQLRRMERVRRGPAAFHHDYAIYRCIFPSFCTGCRKNRANGFKNDGKKN